MDLLDTPSIPRDFGHWLAGFIAGEGCFDIAEGGGKAKGSFTCRFTLALRDDDAAILEEIHAMTGIGRISQIPARNTSKPQTCWTVSRRSDCLTLVWLLDQFSLRTRKAKDYAIWRRAVFTWQEPSRGGLKDFRTELREARRYKPFA